MQLAHLLRAAPILALLSGPVGMTAANAEATAIHSVVTFGDSWSDAGTYGYIFGPSPGSSWSQLLARQYGDDQTAYAFSSEGHLNRVLGGLNYAEGGSKTMEPGHSADHIPLSVDAQLNDHLAAHHAFTADQLVILWTGANDIIAPFSSSGHTGLTADEKALNAGTNVSATLWDEATKSVTKAAQDEAALVKRMLTAGASRIVVLNVIDIGITPFQPENTKPGLALATRLTNTYNAALVDALPKDPRVLLADVDGLVREIARAPEKHGYAHIYEDACGNHDFLCGPAEYAAPNATETYMFGGYGHLSHHSRVLIANYVKDAITKHWGVR